jgi:hypothetical protein
LSTNDLIGNACRQQFPCPNRVSNASSARCSRSREIIVSASVPMLVAGAGFEFEDRGDHELKVRASTPVSRSPKAARAKRDRQGARTMRGSPNVKVALVSGHGPTSTCG